MLQTITVTLDHVELEWDGSTCWDYVAVYDAPTGRDILIQTCGSNGTQVTSTGSTVLITFRSDRTTNHGRFSISWHIAGSGQFSLYTALCPVENNDRNVKFEHI